MVEELTKKTGPYVTLIILFILINLVGCSNPMNERQRVDQSKLQQSEVGNKDIEVFFIEPKTMPDTTYIKVYKELRVLELYGDNSLIGRFKIALGGSPIGDKNIEGDSKTPEGEYYICTRNDKSRFTLFLGLSYPNIDDAKRGLESGVIDEETFRYVSRAIEENRQPPWNTPLGGAVGIHGKGNSPDWTLGCIALSDEDIKILWRYVPLKTKVDIYK